MCELSNKKKDCNGNKDFKSISFTQSEIEFEHVIKMQQKEYKNRLC
jgi:hypothetical protein